MREDIEKILEISVNAPSGSNSQPWKFMVEDNKITVIALPEKDHPILNYRNRGTLIAHGALIENIVITASAFGYNVKTTIFPSANNLNITAILVLESGLVQSDPLFSMVPLRTINRKKYQNKVLTGSQKKELFDAISQFKDIEIKFVEDIKKRKITGDALSINEIVTLENKKLHKLFFEEIVWTLQEENLKQSGLYLKTMELQPPQEAALRLLRNWKMMKLFNYLKFARFIAKDNSKTYSSGAGTGVIIVEDNDKNFLLVGRAVERLWLKAMQMGLSFHLITGTMFFWQGIQGGNSKIFLREHINIVNNAYNKLKEVFGIQRGVIAVAFRIGLSDKPSTISSKKKPEIAWV